MLGVLLYCRAGFEKECAAEIQARASELGIYGYSRVQPNSAWVLFELYQEGDADRLGQKLSLDSLIFARQMFVCSERLEELPLDNRIGPIIAATLDYPLCGELRVEMPDTNAGKELSRFCRKFSVPLRQALRKQQKLTNKEHGKKPILHLLFLDNQTAFVGYSYSFNSSPNHNGILRLKFPSDAPSRSTLKLEEAFHQFIPAAEWDERLAPGMHAVDLGACPGGWTYQLVKRNMFVTCIDNGEIAKSLHDTGQITHLAVDGLKYEPKRKNVTWLVCDMAERPARVAKLMSEWLVKGWCKETIFNLKLPMSKRFQEVEQCMEIIQETLAKDSRRYQVRAKHLYHNREEVTVHIRPL